MICEVCNMKAGWSWTDQNGEATCNKCGAPHQLANGELGCRLTVDGVALLREYHMETGSRFRCGVYLGVDEYQYPGVVAEHEAFNEWMEARQEANAVTS